MLGRCKRHCMTSDCHFVDMQSYGDNLANQVEAGMKPTDMELSFCYKDSNASNGIIDGSTSQPVFGRSIILHNIRQGDDENAAVSYRLIEKDHMSVKERQFGCPQCNYKGVSKKALKAHMKVHGADATYRCELCPFTARHQKTLSAHYISHKPQENADPSKLRCLECAYVTDNKHSLQLHSIVHTDQKRFKCTQCTYRSKYESNVKRHKLIHKGEKLLHCTLCSFKAREELTLTQHYKLHGSFVRMHTFPCDKCDYIATRKVALIKHSEVHNVAKSHKCPHCEYRACLQSSVNSHIAKVHS